MTTRRTLLAAHADTLVLSMGPQVTASDAAGRTMAGMAIPYGPVGLTNIGPVTVRAGAIEIPTTLNRVKLVVEHVEPGRAPTPVGYATAAQDTTDGLRMTFRIGATPEGDAALLQASEGLRDAFSVELSGVEVNAAGEVVKARLTRVALVTTPAFDAALVTDIAASHQTPSAVLGQQNGAPPMLTAEQRARLAELRALNTRTPEQEAELATLLDVALADPEAPPADAPPADAGAAMAASFVAGLQASMAGGPAGIPGGLHLPPSAGGGSGHTLQEFYAAQSRVLTHRSRPDMEAALSDITNTDNIWVAQDGYAGELWEGLGYTRSYVSLMSPGSLTSWKGVGWRWVVRPDVGDYAGDKADVPSNEPTTEDAPYEAARLAGAHDLDRKFWDFGDTAYIASYYAALTNSYAWRSDLKARNFLVANASAMADAAADATLLEMALTLKLDMENAEDDGLSAGSPDFYLVNPTDFRALLDVSVQDVSAFMQALGLDPMKFKSTTQVPAGTVVAGVRQASTFYELSGSPIRVETINIAQGGVDGGVFGYYATLLNNSRGLRKIKRGA